MSAHLSPEELKKIAPDEYARQYGTPEAPADDLEAINAEARKTAAQARLLRARAALQQAEAAERKTRPPAKRETRAAVALWFAIAVAVIQLIITLYIITHY